MQRNARLRSLKLLRFPTLLFLLGAIVSLLNCRTVAEPSENSKTKESSAELLIEQAEDVSAHIRDAQISCEEVKFGWLDIEVEILSGPCQPDCVASSLFLQGRVPWLIRGDFFRYYQERDSFENWVHHPEVFRGSSVMRVDFAADGSSIDSSVVLEEKRGGFDTGTWFDGMAESAELRDPVGAECSVRVNFKANLAYFSGHRNHRH